MEQHDRTTLDQSELLAFLNARPVALVGASADPSKYGNIILMNLRGRGWPVYAVNPRGGEIEGQPAYASLADCPVRPALAVVVTPPSVSIKVLEEARRLGIERVWLQPGAESPDVIARGEQLNLKLVHDACIMVLAAREGV